jgi:hypothetical protein
MAVSMTSMSMATLLPDIFVHILPDSTALRTRPAPEGHHARRRNTFGDYYAEMLPEASGRGPEQSEGPRPLRDPAAGAMRVPPPLPPPTPHPSTTPSRPNPPVGLGKDSPFAVCGRPRPGTTISATLSRGPRFPPSLGRPAFLLAPPRPSPCRRFLCAG